MLPKLESEKRVGTLPCIGDSGRESTEDTDVELKQLLPTKIGLLVTHVFQVVLFLLTPGNDRGGASDSTSQSNQFSSRSFRSIEHQRVHVHSFHLSSLVDKHERTTYYILTK